MRVRFFLAPIPKSVITEYEGLLAFRQTGLIRVDHISGNGIYYHPEQPNFRGQSLFQAGRNGFYQVGAYAPDFEDEMQYLPVHVYSWQSVIRFLPRHPNKNFIIGLHASAPYTNNAKLINTNGYEEVVFGGRHRHIVVHSTMDVSCRIHPNNPVPNLTDKLISNSLGVGTDGPGNNSFYI